MLKIDIQICFTTILPHAKFYRNLSKESGVIELRRIPPPPPRLDRGIERPRLDRVKSNYILEISRLRALKLYTICSYFISLNIFRISILESFCENCS